MQERDGQKRLGREAAGDRDCKRGVRIKPTSLSGLSEAAKGHWHLPHSAANGKN